MGKYLSPFLAEQCTRLARGTLPFDTGNLRYNGTKGRYNQNSIEITVGGENAPYYEFLQKYPTFVNSEKRNPYFNNFERETFSAVFRHIERYTKGKFSGGRFLIKKPLRHKDVYGNVELLKDVDLFRRQRVYDKYNSRDG